MRIHIDSCMNQCNVGQLHARTHAITRVPKRKNARKHECTRTHPLRDEKEDRSIDFIPQRHIDERTHQIMRGG